MPIIRLSFPVEPKAVQSVRFTKSGKRYQPQESVKWKKDIGDMARRMLGDFRPLAEPIGISVIFRYKMPKSRLTKELAKRLGEGLCIPKDTIPDLTDNLKKGFVDALSGIVWKDDKYIVMDGVNAKGYFSENRIDIVVIHGKELIEAFDALCN